MEAELQAALYILTEHDFQDAFKKWQKHWDWCIRIEGATSRVVLTSRPKVPEIIYGYLFRYKINILHFCLMRIVKVF
jgi:hypothetical protein